MSDPARWLAQRIHEMIDKYQTPATPAGGGAMPALPQGAMLPPSGPPPGAPVPGAGMLPGGPPSGPQGLLPPGGPPQGMMPPPQQGLLPPGGMPPGGPPGGMTQLQQQPMVQPPPPPPHQPLMNGGQTLEMMRALVAEANKRGRMTREAGKF
jgi:hypothetical protein